MVQGQKRDCMPVYIGKSGDLVDLVISRVGNSDIHQSSLDLVLCFCAFLF